jgi:hypothetical protein
MKISTIHLNATNTPQKKNILRYLGWGINILSILAISAHWGGGFMAVIGACLLTLILPPIAAIFAFFAAISVWGWPWYLSLLIFLWPIVFLVLGVGIFGSAYLWMRHKFKPPPSAQSEAIDVEYEIIEDPQEKP